MNIQTRKLNVINYIINLDDEQEFRKIESEILKNRKLQGREFRPFTKEELLARVEESMADYKQGKYSSQEELEDESENW